MVKKFVLRKKSGQVVRGVMGKRKALTRKTVAKIAKAVASRGRETKYVASQLFEQPVPIYGDTVPTGTVMPQLFECVPDLGEGTQEYQRVGVKVNPVKHFCDIDLRFNNRATVLGGAAALDTASWDIDVHIWYGYVRRYKNYTDIIANSANILNNLLEDGQGNTFRWNGSPYIGYYKQNSEWLTLKKKVVRMFRSIGDQNTADGVQSSYFPQEIHKRVRVGFKPPKSLLYNETNVIPENYAPVVIIGYIHRDGTQAANSTTDNTSLLGKPALMMNMNNHLFFKDA